MNAVGWSETLIALPENRAALQAVRSLAARLSTRTDGPDLLVLHGPPGTGKTHLAHLLGEMTSTAGCRVAIQSAREAFSAHRKPGETPIGTDDIDLLIIEDLQYLPPHGVANVSRILDERASQGLPTMVTANAGPRHLRHRGRLFPARLTSRLTGGLVVGVQPLQPASRRVFVEVLLRRQALTVPDEIVRWLADQVSGTRALEGAVAQLNLLSRLHKEPLKSSVILDHLQKQIDEQRPTVERIAGHVAGYFQITAKELKSRVRQRSIVVPRQVSMYLTRKLTRLSLHQIGVYFGGCDHTTVMHACRKIEESLTADPAFGGTVRQLHDELA